MKRQVAIRLMVLLFLLALGVECFAVVEWDVRQTLKIGKKPRDAVMSVTGKWIFVV